MVSKNSLHLQDILEAFGDEPKIDKNTLERYLLKYPQYAEYLIDFSSEIAKNVSDNDAAISQEDEILIEHMWKNHQSRIIKNIENPFANLSTNDLREISTLLGIPRSAITGFRECRVIVDSIPQLFLSRFAKILGQTVEKFEKFLNSTNTNAVRSYKSSIKPQAQTKVTFDELLIQAGVSEEALQKLKMEK